MSDIEQVRFKFGKNWSSFLKKLDHSRIEEAEISLKEKLDLSKLTGKRFLDIGSGSGLFSLAARRLGADVHSFDYDVQSVACTQYLKDKYYPNDPNWIINQGSALDSTYLNSLGKFDIVYSWGVLHHTGNMHQALTNACQQVNEQGYLFISIYNDQGVYSKIWTQIKKAYNKYPPLRPIIFVLCGLWLWKFRMAWGLIRYANPLKYILSYGNNNRGMSAYHDLVDWIGGYPFEVAKPEAIFDFFKKKGFSLVYLKTCAGGIGCNEYIFHKTN